LTQYSNIQNFLLSEKSSLEKTVKMRSKNFDPHFFKNDPLQFFIKYIIEEKVKYV